MDRAEARERSSWSVIKWSFCECRLKVSSDEPWSSCWGREGGEDEDEEEEEEEEESESDPSSASP